MAAPAPQARHARRWRRIRRCQIRSRGRPPLLGCGVGSKVIVAAEAGGGQVGHKQLMQRGQNSARGLLTFSYSA